MRYSYFCNLTSRSSGWKGGQESLNSHFGCLGTSVGVVWCLLVSVGVLNCPEIPGGGHCEHMGEVYVCLWGLGVC